MGSSGATPTTVRSSKTRREAEPPRMFKVLLHNDDYTTMEFVVEILRSIFRKSGPDSVTIMLNVHQDGVGVAGVYAAQMAETKVSKVHRRAQQQGYPLRCSVEPE